MAAPVRVGVIGAGAFGERHVRAFARLPDVDLDPDDDEFEDRLTAAVRLS